jgi:hypothetical protein
MAKPDIKLVTPQRSAERSELAAAIEHVSAADNSVEAVRAAVGRANEMVSAASERLEEARVEVANAKEAQTARLVASASSGEALAPDTTLRAARMREIEAADDLDAARDALGLVEQRLDDPELDQRRAKERLERAREAVFVGEVDRLIEEAREAQAKVAEKRAVLQAIAANVDAFRQLAARNKIQSFFLDTSFALQHNYDAWKSHPAAKPWLDVRDALSRDADAELPTS